MSKVTMTINGKNSLEVELKQLRAVVRPKVIEEIATARAHGDLSENSEYDAAKEKQSFLEGRIRDISDKLARADVIDPSQMNHDKIVFGATVILSDLETDEKKTYSIVGEDEADIKSGKLSINAPVARALIGKQVGDEVLIRVPKGKLEYEILEIRYEKT